MAHVDDDEEEEKDLAPEAWIDSPQASIIFGVAILLNCLVMALETDLARDDVDTTGHLKILFMWLEIIFLIVFSGEIIARFQAHLWRFFCDAWNLFDVVVVGIGLVSVGAEILFEESSALGFTSTLRALR